jgi:hypothetical protein
MSDISQTRVREIAAAKQGSRADREAQARRLRDQGLLLREIAERMGVAIQTVHAWLSDPGGEKLAARKKSYGGTCSECGAPTEGSNGPANPAARCLACSSWTPEAILAALRAWAAEHHRSPRQEDWSRTGSQGVRGSVPSWRAVVRHFGGWNEGLLAAGLTLNMDKRPETLDAIVAAIRAGETSTEVAARYGVCPQAITNRLYYHGLSVRAIRADAVPTKDVAA